MFFKTKLTLSHDSNLPLRAFIPPCLHHQSEIWALERWEPKELTCLVVFDFAQGWLLAAVLEVAEK